MGKRFPPDILSQAIDAQEAWGQIDENLAFGNVSLAALVTDINQIRSYDHALSSLESRMTDIRAQRDAACQAAWDKVKRVRAGVKAHFGDDSRQYDMMGCTPLSDRKPPRRTAQPAQPVQ